jgi:hypothetical protein
MSIRGTSDVEAVAMHQDRTTIVSGLTFTDLDIRDVKNGIGVYGNDSSAFSGSCNGFTVYSSYFENMIGSTSGHGYGIDNEGCINARITENEIRSAGRHSIYQSHGRGPVTIDHNLIINHRCGTLSNHTCSNAGSVTGNENLVALVVARTANVVVAHNVILNPFADAMSAELDDVDGRPTPNIRFIHNTVWNTHARDLYISTLTADPVQIWGNVAVHSGSSGASGLDFRGTNYAAPTARWLNTQVFDAVRETVYNSYPYSFVMQNDYLHEVNTSYNQNFDNYSYWTYTGVTSQNFSGFGAMVAGNGVAYVMDGGTLQKLIPNRTGTQTTWSSSASGTTWSSFQGMAWTTNSNPSDVGYLFVVAGNALYQVNPSTWGQTQGITNWAGTQGVTAFSNNAYIMQNNTVHKIRSSLNSSADYLDYWY